MGGGGNISSTNPVVNLHEVTPAAFRHDLVTAPVVFQRSRCWSECFALPSVRFGGQAGRRAGAGESGADRD